MANEFKVKKGLIVDGSETVVDIQGTEGQLFSVTDSLTGDLFSVSDVSGAPIFNVNSSGTSYFDDKLGVGVQSPAQQLHIVGNQVRLDTAGGGYYLYNTSGVFRGAFHDNGTTTNIFGDANGSTPAISIESQNATFAGDVNIATASATSSGKLTVQSQGAQGSDQTALVLRNYSAGNYTGRVTTEYEVGTVNIAELSAVRVDSNNGQLRFKTKQSGTIADALILKQDASADFTGNVEVGDGTDIAMSSSSDGQLKIDGNGYDGAIALDDTAMRIYHNSSIRDLVLGTNETARLTIAGNSGNTTITGTITATNFSGSSSGTNTGDQDLSGFLTDGSVQSKYLRSDADDTGTGQITLADSNTSDSPLILGSSAQTNYTLQQFQTSSHGTNNAYLIAYGASHASQAGNFAMKNTLSGKNLFFEVDSSRELTIENGLSTFAGVVEGSRFVAIGQNTTHGASRLKISQENTTLSELRFYGADTSTAGALRFIGSSSNGSVGGTRLTLNADGSATFTGDITALSDGHSFGASIFNAPGTTESIVQQLRCSDGNNAATFRTTSSGRVFEIRSQNSGTLKFNSTNSSFTGAITVKGGLLYLGEEDTASGHINAKEVMTFNIDTDNDDTNRYFAFYKNGESGSGTELMKIKEDGNVGIGDTAPSSISANTFSLSVNSSRNDLSGALINKANGTIKHQQYWDSSGYGFYLSGSSGDFKWRVNNSDRMVVDKDGGIDLQGTVGQLFSVTNSLSGDLFSVADISGVPILNVNSSGAISIDGYIESDTRFEGKVFIGDQTGYETEMPSSSATLHIHEEVSGSGVAFGNEAHVVISTGATSTGAQGYTGSLWFGSSDHPAAGSTIGAGQQFVWRNAGIASTSGTGDTGSGTSFGNLEFYTNHGSGSATKRLTIASDGIAEFTTTTKSTRFTSTTTSGLHWNNYTGNTHWQIGSDSTAAGMYIYNENGVYAMKLNTSGGVTFAGSGVFGGGLSAKNTTINTGASSGSATVFTVNYGAGSHTGNGIQVGCANVGHALNITGSVGSGYARITTAYNNNPDFYTSGTITAGEDVIAYSDEKLKENIKTLDGSKVYDMRGVSFTRKDTKKEGSGVIAQEIQKVAPELVDKIDGTLGVSYGNITGYLIEAIKDLKAEIEELKKQVK